MCLCMHKNVRALRKVRDKNAARTIKYKRGVME